jgi:hypothetical protein
MSTARLHPARLHVAIRRVVRDAQGIYSLGGFKPDLATRYAAKLVRHLRRLRGISEVTITASLGPKHADSLRWARAICGEWHRVNESKLDARSWELVRLLLPMSDGLRDRLRDELVAAILANTTALPAEGQGRQKPRADDPFADLRRFARARLKGQERAVIEALCDAGGELPIADLAVLDGVSWDDPFNGFRNAQQRLNPKLKPLRWTLVRQSNAAKLSPMKS